MAMTGRPSINKRNREQAKREKQQEKAARRQARAQDKANRAANGGDDGEDPDIAGIVPGPQPKHNPRSKPPFFPTMARILSGSQPRWSQKMESRPSIRSSIMPLRRIRPWSTNTRTLGMRRYLAISTTPIMPRSPVTMAD